MEPPQCNTRGNNTARLSSQYEISSVGCEGDSNGANTSRGKTLSTAYTSLFDKLNILNQK